MSREHCPAPFSTTPDEILEHILKFAAEIPREFEIPHPDDGDPLFNPFVRQRSIYPFPDEAEWVHSLPTRRSLVLVSKRFLRVATPILYGTVFSRGPERLALLWETLKARRQLCILKRIVIGSLESQITVHNRVIECCPNITMIESDTPIQLESLPSGLLSLRIYLDFFGCLTTRATIDQLARFKNLELLDLRSIKLRSTDGDAKCLEYPALREPSNPSLRTVAISDGVPAEWRNDIIHPGAPIRNVIIRDNEIGPKFFHNLLPRMPHVTHIFLLSQARNAVRGTFNPIFTFPGLQHIDLEALWETRGFNDVDLISLQSVVSFSFSLGWFPLREMVRGLKHIIWHQLAPNLRIIYTTRKYWDDIPRNKSAGKMVNELMELLRSAGVEWLVQSDRGTFKSMSTMLLEYIMPTL